jgi:hypothetical protein
MAFFSSLFSYSQLDTQLPEKHFLELCRVIYGVEVNPVQKDIESLIHQVSRDPKNLWCHLHRIFACYKFQQPEQLYAALVDFLFVLSGKGQSLALRMIGGSGNLINSEQRAIFLRYLKQPEKSNLPGNQYTVLKCELLGTLRLVAKKQRTQAERDYLDLAQDFIEYSQLESAIEVLEKGVKQEPSRLDIQEQLLELYRSTGNADRFRDLYALLLKDQRKLVSGWKTMALDFNKQPEKSNG